MNDWADRAIADLKDGSLKTQADDTQEVAEVTTPDANEQVNAPIETEEQEQAQPEPTNADTESIQQEEPNVEQAQVEATEVRKEWADMTHDEQRNFLDKQKKEYDTYNTQNAQANSQAKKELQAKEEAFRKQEQEFLQWRQNEINQMQQGSPQQGQEQGQETEIEMLSRLSGMELDEFSSDNDIINARNIISQNQYRQEETKRRQEEERQRNIDDRYNRWQAIKNNPQENIPQTQEFEEAMFSLVLMKKNYNPNYDVEDAVKDLQSVMGVNTKESFIDYAKKSQYYADLEAQIISDVRQRQANQPTIPTPTGNVSASVPKKYTPTGNLKDSMNAFFNRSRN